jgi:hypothetical protein
MEHITLRVTRPDMSVYEITFTDVRIRKDETGISVYQKGCNNTLIGFYPLTWSLELANFETED